MFAYCTLIQTFHPFNSKILVGRTLILGEKKKKKKVCNAQTLTPGCKAINIK